MNRAIEQSVEGVNKCFSFMGRSPLKEACAEFLATFVLVVLGDGVMASCVLGRLQLNSVLVGSFGWGLALMAAVAIAGGVSGGHVNPAVTVALATSGKCGWRQVIPNVVAQCLGSFMAACVVFITYKDAMDEFDGGVRQIPPSVNATAQVFSTYPQEFASFATCTFDQVVGTALLLIVFCAAKDNKNLRVPPHAHPMIIGLGLTVIALAFGHNCGAPLNPARDLAPRIFTAISGWGSGVFSFRNYEFFWVPVIGPIIGGIVGVWLYKMLIEIPFDNYSRFLDDIENFVGRTAPSHDQVSNTSLESGATSDIGDQSLHPGNGGPSSVSALGEVVPEVKVVPRISPGSSDIETIPETPKEKPTIPDYPFCPVLQPF